uniref:Uncharacterized protein n=1 Tax=Romanomermis culicivorax TaxID=13658 RepID=A0A915HY06_ROMCU
MSWTLLFIRVNDGSWFENSSWFENDCRSRHRRIDLSSLNNGSRFAHRAFEANQTYHLDSNRSE